jgi:hypothetical protein
MTNEPLKPLYAATVADLRPDRLIGVECLGCGHLSDMPAYRVKMRVPSHIKALALPRYFRCRRCDEKNVRLYVGWALNIVDSPMLAVSMADAKRVI